MRTRDDVINEAIDLLSKKTGEDFHGYRSEIWIICGNIYDEASRDSRILSDVSVEQLVNKFLKWQLPASVSSDQCVTQPGLTNRTGTNLLTYIEATQMIEHLLADVR